MMKSLLAACVLALSAAGAASAAPITARPDGIHTGAAAVQNVDRRKVCDYRDGHRHCWWVGSRDWDDNRWQSWHRDNWREGYSWGPGFSLRIR